MTPRRVEWAWTCHFCRSHTMGVFIDKCPNPECQHERCPDCKCEECEQPFLGRKRKMESKTFHSKTALKQTAQIYKEKDAITKPATSAPLPSFQVRDFRISEQQSTTIPIHCTNWRSDRSEVEITPSVSNYLPIAKHSKTATSPTSTASFSPMSTITNELYDNTPSTFESPDTVVDSDGNESGSEASDIEYDENSEDRTIRVLERHVFSVLGNDLELAAKLIPQIYQCYMIGCDQKGAAFTKTPSHKTSDSSEAHCSPGKRDTVKNLQGSITKSNLPKRSRLLEDDDDHDDDDDDEEEDRGHKRSKLNIGDTQLRGFACPFYKKNPDFYHPYQSSRYLKCQGPGPEDFRHLKDHMMAAHGPRQCNKCLVVFAKCKEQLAHRKTDSCRQQQQNHREHLAEDISNELWIQIECLFLTRGRGRMHPDSRTQHSIDKWYEMWSFLFGDLPRPTHPYNEDPRLRATSSSHRAHSPMTVSGDRLDPPLDENVSQQYLAAMDTTLGIPSADFTSVDWHLQVPLRPPATYLPQTSNEISPTIPIGMIPGVRNDYTDLGFLRDNGAQSMETGVAHYLPGLYATITDAETSSHFNTTAHTLQPTDQSLISMPPPMTEETDIGYDNIFGGATITGNEDFPLTDEFLNGLGYEFHQLVESADVNFSANQIEFPAEHEIPNDNAPSTIIDNNEPVSDETTASTLGIEEELRVEGATSSWRGKNRRNIALKGKPGELPRLEDG